MRPFEAILVALMLASASAPVCAADPVPAPGEIVASAPAADWAAIAPSDLLVMDLTADAAGHPRRVVIQLMPAPFSQGWVGNIRKLAAAHWYDGNAIVRVQDNYVVQWGDPASEGERPNGAAAAARPKPLPDGLVKVPRDGYALDNTEDQSIALPLGAYFDDKSGPSPKLWSGQVVFRDNPAELADTFYKGFAYAGILSPLGWAAWPIHCYGTVGVGRDMPPDTGSGAELYAVIGQAPRQLDANIAVIGRVIEGIEFLSSLPRGTGPMGFYERAGERVPIVSVRVGDQVPGLPAYQYLSTASASFARYADARANRRDAFFLHPAGGADICNVPVPVRRVGPGG